MPAKTSPDDICYQKDMLRQVLHCRSLGIKFKKKNGETVQRRGQDWYAVNLLYANSNTRGFKKMDPTITNTSGDVIYEDGTLFVRNTTNRSMDAYSFGNSVQKLRRIWSKPIECSKLRWEDLMVFQTDLCPEYFKACVLVLRSNSWLLRFDLKSGDLNTSIHLYKDVKFTELSTDLERNWLILKSVRSKKCFGSQVNDVMMRFIILNLAPLEVRYHIVIKRSVFGSNCSDVLISNGMIIVMRKKSIIECYNLVNLLEKATKVETSKVDGFYPNLEIEELGPCLFSSRSFQHYLMIDQCQLLYVRKQSEFEFHLCNLEKEIPLLKLKSRNKIEPDEVAFIEDNSARLIQYGEAAIKIFSQPSTDKEINEIFSYEPKMDDVIEKSSKHDPPPPPPAVTTNRFGRRIIRPVSIEEYDDQNEAETYLVRFDYEDELDILAVLVISKEISDQEAAMQTQLTFIKHVRLYQAKHLTLIRILPINYTLVNPCTDVSGDVSINIDRDIIIIKIKTACRTTVLPFQLYELNVNH